MRDRIPVQTTSAPRAIGPYSQAVRCGDLLFASGQVGLDPATGALKPGGIEEEVPRALDNLAAVLQAGGSGLDKVVKTTVFLTDLRDFEVMNRIYERYFGAARPARSTVQVAALPRAARFEIEAIAVVGEGTD